MGYTRIVYLEHAGANLAAHQAGIKLGLSACSAICRQAQAKAPVGIHSVKAYVMPFHTVILQNYILKIWQPYINWYAQNFDSFNYTAGS